MELRIVFFWGWGMSVALILVSVLLNSVAQILMKKGMSAFLLMDFSAMIRSVPLFLLNLWLWGAVLAYGMSFVLWLAVLSKTPVSVAFPFLSIGYVIVAVGGYFFFGERISAVQICGLCAICAGVFLVSR